ncbi:unnamed protein product [Chrysoparadoxa australica]
MGSGSSQEGGELSPEAKYTALKASRYRMIMTDRQLHDFVECWQTAHLAAGVKVLESEAIVDKATFVIVKGQLEISALVPIAQSKQEQILYAATKKVGSVLCVSTSKEEVVRATEGGLVKFMEPLTFMAVEGCVLLRRMELKVAEFFAKYPDLAAKATEASTRHTTDYVASVPLFKDLQPSKRALLLNMISEVVFEPMTLVMNPTEDLTSASTKYYIVVEGTCRLLGKPLKTAPSTPRTDDKETPAAKPSSRPSQQRNTTAPGAPGQASHLPSLSAPLFGASGNGNSGSLRGIQESSVPVLPQLGQNQGSSHCTDTGRGTASSSTRTDTERSGGFPLQEGRMSQKRLSQSLPSLRGQLSLKQTSNRLSNTIYKVSGRLLQNVRQAPQNSGISSIADILKSRSGANRISLSRLRSAASASDLDKVDESYVTVGMAGPGTHFGGLPCLLHIPSPYYVMTESKCLMLRLDGSSLHNFVGVSPGTRTRLFQGIKLEARRILGRYENPVISQIVGMERSTYLELIEDSNLVLLKAGEELFKQGSEGEQLFIVVIGKIQLQRDDKPGEKIIVTEGGYLGECSSLLGGPRLATAVAPEQTLLLSLAKGRMKRHCNMQLWEAAACRLQGKMVTLNLLQSATVFRDHLDGFLKAEMAEESLHCLEAMQEYERAGRSRNELERQQAAEALVESFIHEHAEQEINIAQSLRDSFIEAVKANQCICDSPIFERVKRELISMLNATLPRFSRSKEAAALLQYLRCCDWQV